MALTRGTNLTLSRADDSTQATSLGTPTAIKWWSTYLQVVHPRYHQRAIEWPVGAPLASMYVPCWAYPSLRYPSKPSVLRLVG